MTRVNRVDLRQSSVPLQKGKRQTDRGGWLVNKVSLPPKKTFHGVSYIDWNIKELEYLTLLFSNILRLVIFAIQFAKSRQQQRQQAKLTGSITSSRWLLQCNGPERRPIEATTTMFTKYPAQPGSATGVPVAAAVLKKIIKVRLSNDRLPTDSA